MTIPQQTDGVNHKRIVSVAFFCPRTQGCQGTVTLGSLGSHGFSTSSRGTSKVKLRLKPAALVTLRRKHRLSVAMTVALTGGPSASRSITLH